MDLKDRIVEEAMRMFAENGIKSVRMDDIAAACGISKRTLYENFADRDDLIRQSLRYFVRKFEASMNERLSGAENTLNEFWILFSHGSDFRESNKMVMKDLMKFYPKIFNDFMEKHHCKILETNTERFRRGQAEGYILEQLDAEFMAHNLTDYLYGMQRGFETFGKQKWDQINSIEEITPRSFPFVMMLYFRGMSTEKGREYIDSKRLKTLSQPSLT